MRSLFLYFLLTPPRFFASGDAAADLLAATQALSEIKVAVPDKPRASADVFPPTSRTPTLRTHAAAPRAPTTENQEGADEAIAALERAYASLAADAGLLASSRARVDALVESGHLTAAELKRVTKDDALELKEDTAIAKQISDDAQKLTHDVAAGGHAVVDVSAARLAAIEKANTKLGAMLIKYWGGTDAALRAALGVDPVSSSDVRVEYLADKIARAIVWKGAFIVGAIGSSVTAGHDNCAYDSYENQLERTMAIVWETAEVKWEVRNAGEGGGCGDSHANQVYCTRQMVGDDVDSIHYSWTYFEGGGASSPATIKVHEEFIRFALSMKRAPAPLFFNTGGFTGRAECMKTVGTKNLFDAYAKWGLNVVCLQSGLKTTKYVGKKWGAVGDGLHSTTRYGDLAVPPPLPASASKADIAARRKSLGVVFRNWHPGPLGFQAVADAIAYYYHLAIARALANIRSQVAIDGSAKALRKRWPQKPPRVTTSMLPPPLICDPKICALGSPPSCMNVELPTFGKHQIFSLPMKHDMNPFKAKHYDSHSKGWQMEVSPDKNLVPPDEQKYGKICAHSDRCAGWHSLGKASGWITFRLPRMDRGRIIVCSPAGKKGVEAFLTAGVQWFFNDQELTVTKKNVVFGKCLEVMSAFAGQVNDKRGHCHLGVVSERPISISHVISQ